MIVRMHSETRASKLKDHKIGRSPYFYETKSGDFLRELFKALHRTISLDRGLRNDLRAVVLRRCLLLILASRLNRTLLNPAMTATFMPHDVRSC